VIYRCAELGLEQGLITNGIQLREKIDHNALMKLKWVRISMNSLDYVDHIDIPRMESVLGFSYVINDKTTPDIYDKLREYVDRHDAQYVRVVPNCLATDAEQELNNQVLGRKIAELGPPFFYQTKSFKRPDECYWCYFKPFFCHDGYVYPCSSVVLNADAEGKFNTQYRMGTFVEFLENYVDSPVVPFPTNNCNHCVFASQNEILISLRKPNPMRNFV
jgi:MoaA/NifB/PqqE/SkfB family radical SAM enzyme